jgi:SET domain-containing protein
MLKKQSRKRAVKVLASPNGKGVYAQKGIKKDAVIGKVSGDITTSDDVDPRYLMELDGDNLLIPKGTFRYLNHSCNPNCELFCWEDEPLDPATGTRPLFVSATRSIAKGKQLTIDYGWPAEFAIPCNCKSKQCRGWIVDKKELAKLKKKLKRKSSKK